MMNMIKTHRAEIEAIDQKIIEKIADRFDLCKKIGLIKKQKKRNTKDTSREAYLLKYYEKQCQHYDVDFDFIKKIFSLIITESKRLQNI